MHNLVDVELSAENILETFFDPLWLLKTLC